MSAVRDFAAFCRGIPLAPPYDILVRWKGRKRSLRFTVTAVGEELVIARRRGHSEVALDPSDWAAADAVERTDSAP